MELRANKLKYIDADLILKKKGVCWNKYYHKQIRVIILEVIISYIFF